MLPLHQTREMFVADEIYMYKNKLHSDYKIEELDRDSYQDGLTNVGQKWTNNVKELRIELRLIRYT
jgi:hypothetical protein